jgi:anti-anti-sigma factor
MRSHGQVTELREGTATDHVCWVYTGDDDLDAGVGRFLEAGLERGERVLGVGETAIESLRRQSAEYGGGDLLGARGVLETLTLAEAYAAAGEFAAGRQRDFYDAATRRALADGFTGLRVVADVSAVAADGDHRPALVHWEHTADEYAVHGPGFTAMCLYRADLGTDALTDVATVHPLVRAPAAVAPFQVFFDDDHVVLAGSVDTFSAPRLEVVLTGSPAATATVTRLDLGRLEFVDVTGCRVLARWAQRLEERGGRLEVVRASRPLRRIWGTLALHGLAPVTFVGEPA